MKRRHVLSAVLCASAVLSGCAGSSRTRLAIEGEWVIEDAVLAGQPVPLSAIGAGKLHLDAGRYEFQEDHGDYVVLPGTTPAALDVHGTDGPNAGKTFLAIYSIKDDAMTIVYDLSGTHRPGTFQSHVGTREYLVHYRRAA